jgi:capsular polysaccharide transport system permease protein
MPDTLAEPYRLYAAIDKNRRIIWALLLRELSTRYGRDNLGFLWLILEPLVFAGSVSVLWSFLRTPFENGIPIVPFVVTGYLPLILVRQTIGYATGAVRVNSGLLYHRQITPLHIFVGRYLIEFIGVSFAFVVIVGIFNILGLMGLPSNVGLLLEGWFILSLLAFGLAMIAGALAEVLEFMDKIVGVITYIYIPFSGSFIMVAAVAPKFRSAMLFLPFIHCSEMIRRGYFGEFIATYYNAGYALEWAAGFILIGLFLVQFVRSRVEVD